MPGHFHSDRVDMVILELPEMPERDVALLESSSADSARSRFLPPILRDKAQKGDEDPLRGRLTLAEPFVQPLTPAQLAEDPDLARYVSAKGPAFSFFLVGLKATFRARDHEEFYKASLQVDLRREDALTSPPVIAWSMTPLQETETTRNTRRIAIGPKITIASLGVEPGVQVETEETFDRITAVVQGYYEGASNPMWEFRKGKTRGIDGVTFLTMVVRTPAQLASHGLISAEATLRRARLGIIPYRAELTDPSLGRFSLL
jgi:hypothetical protein